MCAGAPLAITEDLLTTFNISLVVRGSISETGIAEEEEQMRYSVPKRKGIMRCVLAFFVLTTCWQYYSFRSISQTWALHCLMQKLNAEWVTGCLPPSY
jgi:hypothetical protein